MRIRTHVNPFTLNLPVTPPDWDTVFGSKTATYDFEIGFGKGVFLRQYAQRHPDRNIIGVEVRAPLVTQLNAQIETLGLTNTYLVHSSAENCLRDIIPDASLDNIFIFHPDPWFKTRHHKRRVVNASFLKTIYPKLVPNGAVWISTDVAILFEAMVESIQSVKDRYTISENESFWTTDYTTHWTEFSHVDNRQVQTITIRKI